jgi:hypothetical protein
MTVIEKTTLIGKGVPKLDAPKKVSGQARYVQDIELPGMLHAKFSGRSGSTRLSGASTPRRRRSSPASTPSSPPPTLPESLSGTGRTTLL